MEYLKAKQARVVYPPALPPVMHRRLGSTRPAPAKYLAALLQSSTSTIPQLPASRLRYLRPYPVLPP